MDKIYIGVATLPERREFFENQVLPSLLEQADGVFVYHDKVYGPDYTHSPHPKITRLYRTRLTQLGDAGKFWGLDPLLRTGDDSFYYFTCDDDLIYPSNYCQRMIEWIEHYDRSAVVSLHGSTFPFFPIESYYKNRRCFPVLGDVRQPIGVTFPGTGCMAFHTSTIQPLLSDFPMPNMADIWMGLLLQKQEVPAIVLPHSRDYLTYNHNLPLADTIWGQAHNDDSYQTKIINLFSEDRGFAFFPPRVRKGLPEPLAPERPLDLHLQEQSPPPAAES